MSLIDSESRWRRAPQMATIPQRQEEVWEEEICKFFGLKVRDRNMEFQTSIQVFFRALEDKQRALSQ